MTRRSLKSITPWLLLIVLISPGWVHGQLFERPVVLQGVSAVSPGSTVENLTITIRGGRITEISESADVPLMSKKIDAKGLFATAGLVDHASVLTLPVGGAGEAGQWRIKWETRRWTSVTHRFCGASEASTHDTS